MKNLIVTILLIVAARQGLSYAPKAKGKVPVPFGLQTQASDFKIEESPTTTTTNTGEPLMSAASAESGTKLMRHAGTRKKWGIDKVHTQEYWCDYRIHSLGNIGIGGAFHAALAPLSTKLIDVFAYGGIDIRAKVASMLSQAVATSEARVLDLCCGVGISTRALRDAFPDAEAVIGLDTSPQMIAMADFLARHIGFVKPVVEYLLELLITITTMQALSQQQEANDIKRVDGSIKGTRFVRGNSEETHFPANFFDLVTIMYAFHEVPKAGRDKILEEARRLLKPGGTLAVVDIAVDYLPTKSMLLGEPYVLEYQKNIHPQINKFKGFLRPRYHTIVPGHVGMWLLQRA